MQLPQQELAFRRTRLVVWACDVQDSTTALNDDARVDQAEQFLQRFYWLAKQIGEHTGAHVQKWTGDGFLLGYSVTLDRDLGAVAAPLIGAAWHLSYLANVTSLGVSNDPFLRLRHGIAFDPDAIVVTTNDGDRSQRDMIGRGVVFASRLAGLPAPFPNCVVHGAIIRAATLPPTHQFRKRRVSPAHVLRYFKGERKWTDDVFESCTRTRPPRSVDAMIRRAERAIDLAHSKEPPTWLPLLLDSMAHGPDWAREVRGEWLRFTKEHLLGNLVTMVSAMKERAKA